MASELTRLELEEPAASRRLGHVPGLDGVRGLAVLLVVGLHFGILLRPGHVVGGRVVDRGLLPGGLVGVDLFFVLSGFLITSLLISERMRTGGIAMGGFYARRACRLLPALFALVIAHAILSRRFGIPIRLEGKAILAVVLYVGNWAQSFGMKIPTGLGHTWTLSVEEQFYLVWPIGLLVLTRFARTRRAVLMLIVAGILASALIRGWIWVYGSGYPAAYMRTDARADGLLIGALAALLWRWRMVPPRVAYIGATIALPFLMVFALVWDETNKAMFYGGFTAMAVVCAAIILAVAEGGWRALPFFELRVMRLFGRVSYGLYLWHVFALWAVGNELRSEPRATRAAVALAVTAGLTTGSWLLIEKPFLKLKDRWSTDRRLAPAPASGPAPESA